MKTWKTLVIAGMLVAGNAFATDREITFDFDVYSDGADLWVCNSGLKTGEVPVDADGDGLVDNTETGTATSDPALDTDGNGFVDSTETGTAYTNPGTTGNDGDILRGGYDQNLMVTTITNADGTVTTTNTALSGNGEYNYSNSTDILAAGINGDSAWSNELTDLSFALGSDFYDAKYFVEFCWENSGAYDNINLSDVIADANFEFLMSSAHGSNYATNSGLETTYSVSCDNGETWSSANADSYQNGTAAGGYSVSGTTANTPKKCVLRFDYCETSNTPRLDDLNESGDFSVTGRVYFGFDDAVSIPDAI